jgi:hypothetical protein
MSAHESFISDFKDAHDSIGGRLKLITEFCIQLGKDDFFSRVAQRHCHVFDSVYTQLSCFSL